MMHPDYEMMIVRQEIDRRLRESLLDAEVRKARTRPQGLWHRIVLLAQAIITSLLSKPKDTQSEVDCFTCGPSQA